MREKQEEMFDQTRCKFTNPREPADDRSSHASKAAMCHKEGRFVYWWLPNSNWRNGDAARSQEELYACNRGMID